MNSWQRRCKREALQHENVFHVAQVDQAAVNVSQFPPKGSNVIYDNFALPLHFFALNASAELPLCPQIWRQSVFSKGTHGKK